MARRVRLPKGQCPWALDSGGFTEIEKFGRYETHPGQYAQEVYTWREEVGNLRWAAVQDWMCEPIARSKTGKSVREHQELTIESYQVLRQLTPDLPWIPVLQGWRIEDYIRHVEMYRESGLDLWSVPAVGVGTVCRRQGTVWAGRLFKLLSGLMLPLHAFGLKTTGLKNLWPYLESADSMAWSFGARRGNLRLRSCEHRGRDCRNCLDYALYWRRKILDFPMDDPADPGALKYGRRSGKMGA